MTASLNFNDMNTETLAVVITGVATIALVLVRALTVLATWWSGRGPRIDTRVQTKPVLLITLEAAPTLAILSADNIELKSPGGHKPMIAFTNGGVGPLFELSATVEVKTGASGSRRAGMHRLGRIGDRDLQVLEFPRAVFVGKAVPGFGFSPLARKLEVGDCQAFSVPTVGAEATRLESLSPPIALRWVLDNISERHAGGATLVIKARYRDLQGHWATARRSIYLDVIGRIPGDDGVTWQLCAGDADGGPMASMQIQSALVQATNDDWPSQGEATRTEEAGKLSQPASIGEPRSVRKRDSWG